MSLGTESNCSTQFNIHFREFFSAPDAGRVGAFETWKIARVIITF